MPEALFKNQITSKLIKFNQACPETKVVLVPSLEDLSHDYSFPQCAYQPPLVGDLAKISTLLPNPGVFFVNEFSLAVSSPDALLRLGLTEVSRAPKISERFTRLASHFFEQGSFYPCTPAAHSIALDYNYQEGLEFPFKPDLFITPSALRHFAKVCSKSVVVNPGQFCRKQSLGSAAHIIVHPSNDPSAVDISSRTRVDIIQF